MSTSQPHINTLIQSDSRKKLIQLGIDKAIIDEAFPKEISHHVYAMIRSTQDTPYNRIKFTAAWQLQALSGDLDFYKTCSDNLLDNMGYKLAFYAAWSGNPEALLVINERFPALIKDTPWNLTRSNILHFAAWSGNYKMFETVMKLGQIAVFVSDSNNKNVVYFAALSGNKEMFKKLMLDFPLVKEDVNSDQYYAVNIIYTAAQSGNTNLLLYILEEVVDDYAVYAEEIGRYAARSGNVEMLEMVYKRLPIIMKNTDLNKLIYYAALSGNTEQLNLLLEKNQVTKIVFSESYAQENETNYVAKILSKALKKNTLITQIKFNNPELIDDPIKQTIEAALKQNQNIVTDLPGYIPFLQESNLKSHVSQLPEEIRQHIVAFAMGSTKGVTSPDSHIVEKAYQESAKTILDQIYKEIETLKKPGKINPFFFFIKSSEPKVRALEELYRRVENNQQHETFHSLLTDWQQDYGPIIKEQRNRLHALLLPSHKSNTSQFVKNLDKTMGSRILPLIEAEELAETSPIAANL